LESHSEASRGYRIYPNEVLDRLSFIHDAKRLGFSLREAGELLSLGVKSTLESGPRTRKAQAKLAAMNDEISRLQSQRRTLRKMIVYRGGCPARDALNPVRVAAPREL
jgi:DNA-binding transcriptional MerR regulator